MFFISFFFVYFYFGQLNRVKINFPPLFLLPHCLYPVWYFKEKKKSWNLSDMSLCYAQYTWRASSAILFCISNSKRLAVWRRLIWPHFAGVSNYFDWTLWINLTSTHAMFDVSLIKGIELVSWKNLTTVLKKFIFEKG